MDVLSHLLWLKVRMVGRAWRHASSSGVAVLGVLFGLVSTVGFSALVLMAGLECGPILGRTVLGGALFGLYAGWLLGPAFGYRLNEAIDPTVLAHFPVSNQQLMLGLFLGNFLDPVVLVSSPLVLACMLAGWIMGGSLFWGGLGALLFLFHAMGTAQVIHIWSLALLRRRRTSEILFVVVALMLLAALAAFEVGVLSHGGAGRLRTLVELAQDWSWIDQVITWTPAGLALEAMMPETRASVFGPAGACLILFGVSGASVGLAARYTRRVLSGGGATGGARGRDAALRPDRLVAFFLALGASRPIAARAAAECRLVLREPQYLLLYVSYPVAYGAATLWASTSTSVDNAARAVLVGIIVLSSIFIFTGVVFNSLAVERSGLKHAFAGPMEPLGYLIGKNLGDWLLLTAAHLFVVLLGCLGMGLGLATALGFALAGQAAIWVLLGLGNLGSCLAPIPLPVHGTSPRQAATFGRVFLVMLVNSVGMLTGGGAAAVTWVLVFGPPLYLGGARLSILSAGLGLGWLAGVYALSTWLGARLLAWRRDHLLEMIAK